MASAPYAKRAGSYLALAAVGVVPTIALVAIVEFVFFSGVSSPSGGLSRLVTGTTSGLQFLGFSIACALIARAIAVEQTGRKASTGRTLAGPGAVAGPLLVVVLVCAVVVGALSVVAYALGLAAGLVFCLAPVATAWDGGTAWTALRRGFNAVLRAPGPAVLILGTTYLLLIFLDMMRLAFSMTAAQFGQFSYGVQGAAAAVSTVIVAGAGVALSLLYSKTR